jgi:hypothetical protein
MPKIESAKPVHCVELVTGKSLTGTLLLSEEEINVRIYSYADHFYIEGEQPVFLQTETNEIVSLHSNITTIPGTHSRNIEPRRTTYRQEIVSNVAVVGHDPWTAQHRVKRVSFSVKHTKELMHHDAKVKAIGRSKHPTEEHLTIFNDPAEGMTLRAWYAATYGMDFDAPKELWPSFEIEFDEPQSIQDYILHVSDYVNFLSFCFGTKLTPSEIRIDRLSFTEMQTAIESHSYLGKHEVHYIWPEAEIDERDLWVGGSPVRAWDDQELGSFRESLAAWMNRAAAWRKPYRLMMVSFGLKNVISSERLINACRWFEDIPVAKARAALSNEHIEAISIAATGRAHELGHDPAICERITGAIRRLRAESTEQQFTRLIAMIEKTFGSGILPEDAVVHLKRAIYFRGRSAHGHFNPESDAEFRAFSKSTRAMEALCYLLTAFDLPIFETGIKRVKSNPLIRDYRMAYD